MASFKEKTLVAVCLVEKPFLQYSEWRKLKSKLPTIGEILIISMSSMEGKNGLYNVPFTPPLN
jgi:hypothetical protein